MKTHFAVAFTVAIIITFVAGYGLGLHDRPGVPVAACPECPEAASAPEVSVPEPVVNLSIMEPDDFSGVEELDDYLKSIKATQEFKDQQYIEHYNEQDYARWLVNKFKSDGYNLDIQYEMADDLEIEKIYCSYTFGSDIVVFIDPGMATIEKKFHITPALIGETTKLSM